MHNAITTLNLVIFCLLRAIWTNLAGFSMSHGFFRKVTWRGVKQNIGRLWECCGGLLWYNNHAFYGGLGACPPAFGFTFIGALRLHRCNLE